jgi:hypothetical protein
LDLPAHFRDFPPITWLGKPFFNTKTVFFRAAAMFGTNFNALTSLVMEI